MIKEEGGSKGFEKELKRDPRGHSLLVNTHPHHTSFGFFGFGIGSSTTHVHFTLLTLKPKKSASSAGHLQSNPRCMERSLRFRTSDNFLKFKRSKFHVILRPATFSRNCLTSKPSCMS